ncbi:hypothetical protein B0T19DRAFT_430619 [Cercophora scortea]|uniref:Heat shock protein 30 n=1 Tax=Cercophora scortea TaxID=314031 RepID=A0AAE0M6X9_9PEZI|nr:hypothetical protein B0T19DRAFT_430619 [Cercophora scortea]
MAVFVRNDALDTNPPEGDQYLTVNGSDWLFTVAAVYALSFLTLYGLTHVARAGERFFHYLFLIATFTGAVSYFASGSDLGWSLVVQANNVADYGLTRQIFFTKYINWVVAFPTAIIALGVLSGVAWATIAFNVALSWAWVISYLVGAYVTTNYKWGFFAAGTFAYLLLAIGTLTEGRRAAIRVGSAPHYTLLAGAVNLLWLLYPIAYGLSDGGNRLGLTSAFVWFGVLDVLLIPGLAFAFVALSRSWDYNKLNIAFTQYGRVPTTAFPEKQPAPAAGGVAETTV